MHPEVAHAVGLSIIFPSWILHNNIINPYIFKRWAKNVWQCDSVEAGVQKMRSKFSEWGSPITLAEIGIKESEFDLIADHALLSGKLGALKELNKKDVLSILNIASK